MSCWTKEQLENMLEDVVNELDLSDSMIEHHGPLGTPPATLVRLVLAKKDREIAMLKAGMKEIRNVEGHKTDDKSAGLEGVFQAVREESRRSVEKHGDWSDLLDMKQHQAIQGEFEESVEAYLLGDTHGPHGEIAELTQLMVVCAKRIMFLQSQK